MRGEKQTTRGKTFWSDVKDQQIFALNCFSQIHVLETPFLNIDCGHLKNFDADLYRQLVCYPQEVIPTFDMSVNEVFFEKYPGAQLQHQIQVW